MIPANTLRKYIHTDPWKYTVREALVVDTLSERAGLDTLSVLVHRVHHHLVKRLRTVQTQIHAEVEPLCAPVQVARVQSAIGKIYSRRESVDLSIHLSVHSNVDFGSCDLINFSLPISILCLIQTNQRSNQLERTYESAN